MIDQLTDAECEITECVARRLNVVIEAVEALRRQIEQHIAAGDGAAPVEGPMYPSHAAALRAVKRCEADVQALREDNETLRAERDAAQARLTPFPATETCQECGSALGIGFHIADDVWAKISPTGGEGGVLCPWCADKRLKALGYTDVPAVFFPAFDVLRDEPGEWERRARQAEERVRELEKEDTERLERGREKARHMEKEIATLKHAVREARGNLDYGHIWTPNDTQYVRDVIAALSAALDEEATDAE